MEIDIARVSFLFTFSLLIFFFIILQSLPDSPEVTSRHESTPSAVLSGYIYIYT